MSMRMGLVPVPLKSPEGDWVEAMRAGDFERAWSISDRDLAALCRTGPAKHVGPRHLQRIWRGEELCGKRVLVRCYHGLGDTIQFLRFMPALRRIAREVMVWCQPELLCLVERVEGVDRALPLHDGTPETAFDADIEIMEIPHAIKATRDTVEMQHPYLSLPPVETDVLPEHTGALAVGVVWEVGDWDKRRAIPAALLRRLGGEGIDLYSLQRGPASRQFGEFGAKDFSTPDICQLGQRIRRLDFVICVDTMVAHLAGALGIEAWVLLHADRDWRWPASGDRSFWYPSLRLFHQEMPGRWAGVVEEVRIALCERARGRYPSAAPTGGG